MAFNDYALSGLQDVLFILFDGLHPSLADYAPFGALLNRVCKGKEKLLPKGDRA